MIPYDVIGERLGISKQACQQAYKREIRKVTKQNKKLGEYILTRELETLEDMRRIALEVAYDLKAEPKDRLTAVKLVTENVEKVCKLTGIAAPITIETKNTNVNFSADQFNRMAMLLANEVIAADDSGHGSQEEDQ